MDIVFTKAALRALVRMPKTTAQRIRAKIGQDASDPASLSNNITAMAGSDYIRLRVGNCRVIMLPDGTVLEIIDIGPRGGIYD